MYLALARKYRPQKFEDLIGQPHITKTLQNAIEMDKLYPSLIFSGMKGVGKTSSARILAKTLNCEKGPAIEPCNQCSTCIEITEDKSPDYIEIDGASNNGVEEVRNLKEKVKYKPFKNKFRVVVIDEVHMLSNSAWNALLKTIEEPPDHTYFVMATTDFHKIPATIVSRCQQFEFKRIPQEIIVKLLREVCDKESVKINDYALYLVAKASEGSLRDAKKILDQAIAISSGDVKDQDVIDILGVIEEEIFITLTQHIFSRDRKGIIEQINTLAERGMDLRFFYNEYLKFLRDLLVLKSLENSEKLHNLNPENIPQLREMLKNVREVELLRYFNAAKDLEQTIRNTENPRIILEYLFLKLSFFPSLMSIEELIEKAQGGGLAIPSMPPVAQPAAPAPETSSTASIPFASDSYAPPSAPPGSGIPFTDGGMIEDVPPARPSSAQPGEKSVHKLLDEVKKQQPRIAATLNASTITLNDGTLNIKIPGDLEYAYNNILDNSQFIKDLISRITGKNTQIDIRLDEKVIDEKEARIRELRQDKTLNSLADRIKGKIGDIEKIE